MICCPYCSRKLPLSTLKEARAEMARRDQSRRTPSHGGGRPKVERPCPKCGVLFGAAELRKHLPGCS